MKRFITVGAILFATCLLKSVNPVPTSDKVILKSLTKVGVEAIRNDLTGGLQKLEDVHRLMSDDERVRIIAMHSANQTHQIALGHLLTELSAFQETNQTCMQSLQQLYVQRCLPCVIQVCEERYDSYCRLVPVRSQGLARLDTADFDFRIREFIGDNVNDLFNENVRDWFENPDGDFVELLDDLEWLWGQIQQTADDISDYGTDDFHSWFTEITDNFIEFFVDRLEKWLKNERDDIGDSLTDKIEGWYDEVAVERNGSRTVGGILDAAGEKLDDLWQDFSRWADETQDRVGDKLEDVADDIGEFYDDKLSHRVEQARNRTQEVADEVLANVNDAAENARELYDNVRPYVDEAANRTRDTLGNIGDALDDITVDVGGWFDQTFGDIFDTVANQTKGHLSRVFDDISNLFGGPYYDGRRRRALTDSDSWDWSSSSAEQNRNPTCEELNEDDTRGRACMKFAAKCSECDMLPERDCPGFVRAKEAVANTLFDFRNATAIYRSVFEAFKEGQLEYHTGLQKLARRYRWISKFQQLPRNKRGYRVIKLNFDPEVEDDDLSDEFAPVEATVVMFGEQPHSFVVRIPVDPWNYDIAGTMIAARALAWYASLT